MAFSNLRHYVFFLLFSAGLPFALAGGTNAVPASKPAATPAIAAPVTLVRPLWSDLNVMQKQALAPLAGEWDKFPEGRKKKWLEIVTRYAKMKPEEQVRVQERMREWIKLTPEQRMAARENFAKSSLVKPEQKSAQWQQYQQLSAEEKQRLAQEHAKKKSVTNLSPDLVKNPQILAPIKLGPKPPAKPALAAPIAPISPAPASATALVATPASASSSLPAVSEPAVAPAAGSASQAVSK